jgi:hypothetical protein
MAKYFREVGQQIKAYHYYLIGRSIPYPKDDMLFIENHIYDKYLFEYESTILHYYLYLTDNFPILDFFRAAVFLCNTFFFTDLSMILYKLLVKFNILEL